MATHYWPGEDVGALPAVMAWDSRDWDTLPVAVVGHDPELDPYNSYVGIVGFDGPLLETQQQGHQYINTTNGGTWWSIVGTGQEVTFRTVGETFGHVLLLIRLDFVPGLYNSKGLVAAANVSPERSRTQTATALTAVLDAGVTYHLAVSSYGQTAENRFDAASGYNVPVYGQSFSMTVELTDRQTNKISGSAADVIIPSDGATYHSNKCLNALNESNDADRPSGLNISRPFWWVYTPETAGEFTLTAYCDPEDWPSGVEWYLKNGDGSWGSHGTVSGNPATLTKTLAAEQSIWFAVGTADTSFRSPAEIFDITVTGKRSTVQAPVTAPDNDLRSNATHIYIPTDAVATPFTSLWIDNTYATSDNVSGTDDPTDEFLYHTVWWKYDPLGAGPVTATLEASPASADVTLLMYKTDADGSLYQAGETNSGEALPVLNDNVNPATEVDATRYFVIGTNNTVSTGISYLLTVDGPATTLPPDPDPDPDPDADPDIDPGGDPPPDPDWDSDNDPPPDKFTPDAEVPERKPDKDKETGSASLLDIVREFSGAVKRAVRIIGPTTIEMIDPAVPLPTGMTNADATGMYSTTTRTASAEDKVISIYAGNATVGASANVVSDDVRIVRSTWRIPNRLPVYGLPAAPVKRITYTYTPTGFTASVDFHFAGVPIEARRL